MIKKILVANRGEIAIRVIRTCREMNIRTVAIYSDQDANAPHVQYADEAYRCGPAPASESYLRKDVILDLAIQSNSDAVHPGYGFLSENDAFVELLTGKGIVFVGPSASAIRMMGDKTEARRIAQECGVPIVPGVVDPLESVDEAKSFALRIGYPILLKAAGGGGGKGMRIVHQEKELESNLRSAMSEALSSFGDNRVYIEKYIARPRHIEVQILADSHGNIVHLGERECSIQRRHQKIIEESPSTVIDRLLREEMTKAAIKLVRKSNYTNAGTLEFLLDEEGNFFFLEMNTRLQVEHPVTEMVTGLDLVREQIRIAEGERLSFVQDQVSFTGHAIECRIYAEDSDNNFYPSTGTIQHLRPASGPNTRDDRGVEEGDVVSPFYDPLLAKLICWGRSREEALDRIRRALEEYQIYGVKTNISLCLWIVTHAKFISGDFDTSFLQRYFTSQQLRMPDESTLQTAIAAVALIEGDFSNSNPEGQKIAKSHHWVLLREDNLR